MTREELNKERQKDIENEAKRNRRKKIVIFITKTILLLTILISGFYFFNTYVSTAKLIVKENRIIDSKIPESFNGLKIIQFSDLHYGSNIFIKQVNSLVKTINRRKPDVVVFTGDLIEKTYDLSSKEQEKLIKELNKIEATIGKYAVIGDEDKDNFITIFNQSNFSILNNSYDLIYKDSNKPLLLIGISSSLSEKAKIDEAYSYFNQEIYNSEIYTISIMHEPDLVDSILQKYKSDLFLAGHSHNGNVILPYFGNIDKIEGAKVYNEEFYQLDENNKLYISSGVGTNGNGVRLFCQPSINFFRLSNNWFINLKRKFASFFLLCLS